MRWDEAEARFPGCSAAWDRDGAAWAEGRPEFKLVIDSYAALRDDGRVIEDADLWIRIDTLTAYVHRQFDTDPMYAEYREEQERWIVKVE